MKKIILLTGLFYLLTAASATAENTHIPEQKINVITDCTAIQMDMAQYEDTVYEALISTDTTEVTGGIPIFINKYKDNKYVSTLRIDLQEFYTYEFSERFSHYDFLKIYPLAKNEIILTVYFSNSTHHFAFLRIKNGKIIKSRFYNFEKQDSYETQEYAFNGKDRIYIAFNGKHNFSKTSWDLYLMSFDLNGELKSAVTVLTNKYDELTGLCAFKDKVYFSIRQGFENQAILQFDKDLKSYKPFAFKYAGSGIRLWSLSSDSKRMIVSVYKEEDESTYHAVYSPDGKFLATYKELIDESDGKWTFTKSKISDKGILHFGTRYNSSEWQTYRTAQKNFISYFMNWDGIKTYEHGFREQDIINFKDFAFVDGKFFCTGEDLYETYGIGHIAYNYLIEEKAEDSNIVTIEKTDYNPFAVPADENSLAEFKKEEEFWNTKVKVSDEEVPEISLKFAAQIMKMDFKHTHPANTSVKETITLFPFSER